jgi:4-hydroxy-3-methylbut-2-enyl diphosphate reductase
MRLIEQELAAHGVPIYTLGAVIHNPQEVERLHARGVVPISSLDELEEGAVLILRAHGVHPDFYREAERMGVHLIDATCPFVQRSQKYVKRLLDESYRVIIIGDGTHPEVQSISGHAGDRAVILETVEEARALEPLEKGGVVIQTTFSREKARQIIDILTSRIRDLRIYDTVCQATVLRREATLELAEDVELMLVVGGRESSNTRRLYQMCVDADIPARFIETADEIDPAWFEDCHTVGLTTGTSTPDWVIEDVLKRLDELSVGG